jgi:signal transduction histidine kinase
MVGGVYIETQRRSALPTEESRLAASLAHEINNPLDSVLNLLYLVEAEVTLTAKGRQYLTMAQEEVQRVAQITHAALDYFRDFATLKNTNLPALLDSVIGIYQPRFEARGICVVRRTRLDGSTPVYSGPLRQVFSNLLLNAADAMPKGGRLHARLSAWHERSGRQRHGVRVTIADNGCGIEAENLHRIFEPFFTTKGSGGSGLGLSLVAEVVQKHGGRLQVRSSMSAGRSGSVFSIFLPVD